MPLKALLSNKLLKALLGLLLLLIPWHEFVVHLWKPLGAWKEAVAAAMLLVLAARGPARWRSNRLTAPILSLVSVTLLSAGCNASGLAPARFYITFLIVALAASQLAAEKDVLDLCRAQVAMATIAAVYALLSFFAFRAVGGGSHLRPPVDSLLLRALVYPYYCGVYPRGWRLIGPFFNDNYFGAWMAAMICLALTAPKNSKLQLVTLGSAWALTFSRSATLGLFSGLAFLAWRLNRRVLWMLPIAFLASIPFATSADISRFIHPVENEGGRLATIARAVDDMKIRPLLGSGPGTRGLADMEYAKIASELGLLGLLAYLWLGFATLRPAFDGASSRLVLGGAVISLGASLVGSDGLEVPQIAVCLWANAGLLARLDSFPGRSAEHSSENPAGDDTPR